MNEQLKQALKQEDTVIFLGSGISCWSVLPSWTGLLNQLADLLESSGRDAELVRRETKQDLLQAASYGFDQLTPSEIGGFIRSACQHGTAVPHEIHRKIVSLGPRCFITTNYDQLLEESLRKWKHGRPFRIVTNKQPFEEADIIQSRSVDFIFKPHGDVGDVESIVLTREQYRKLLEGGEWKHALESLKTLLVTRRVVYLGFGLRDPDFLLLRDVLANTWKGGTRDHYAIMADVGSGEVNYWRKNYGIHLVGYATTELPAGKRDHGKLLELLDECLQPISPATAAGAIADIGTELILALLRYASGLMRFELASPELPLRVHSSKGWRYARADNSSHDRWDHAESHEFLEAGPQRAILLGLPGAGKSYGLKKAASQVAQKLRDSCLAQPSVLSDLVIPMYADMKLYNGNVAAMLEMALPAGITIEELAKLFRVRVFLDSFNEMPRDQLEGGGYEIDIPSFLKKYPATEMVIGSRTDDGLEKLGFPIYWLDEIDSDFLKQQLNEKGITLAGRFADELTDLLRKPFYFQLVISGRVKLPEQPLPRDLYHAFFSNLSAAFADRFGSGLDLAKVLSPLAYEAISKGSEALPVQALYQSLNKEMQALGLQEPTVETLANWLVSQSLLLPYSGERFAFFHQSVTEFLAANELAIRFRSAPAILKEKLTLNRWDQAILLTLSILSKNESNTFLEAVMNADFALALRATKYLEINREAIVAKLLAEIPSRLKQRQGFDLQIESALNLHVPVTEAHEAQLRTIMKCGNMVGGCAAGKLLHFSPSAWKSQMLTSLLEKRGDYNFCSNLGRALQPLVVKEDLTLIAEMADAVEQEMTDDEEDSATHGFVDGISEALAELELAEIMAALLPKEIAERCPKARSRIVLELIRDRHSTEALEVAAELLLRGFKEACFSIYAIAKFGREERSLSWNCFTEQHVSRLVDLLGDVEREPWSLDALKSLCKERPDLAVLVETHARNARGLRQAALFNALGNAKEDSVFEALERFLAMNPTERQLEPEYLLGRMKVNWAGREGLFLRLLRLRKTHLAWCLLDGLGVVGPDEPQIGNLDIGDVTWWLDWLADAEDPEAHWWFGDRLSRLFAIKLTTATQMVLLAEFNRADSKYRQILACTLLNARTDLTTDDFSEDAVAFLLRHLSDETEADPHESLLLGRTATEPFVNERLLPMLEGADEPLRTNLSIVLGQAGRRHGRRYSSGSSSTRKRRRRAGAAGSGGAT